MFLYALFYYKSKRETDITTNNSGLLAHNHQEENTREMVKVKGKFITLRGIYSSGSLSYDLYSNSKDEVRRDGTFSSAPKVDINEIRHNRWF